MKKITAFILSMMILCVPVFAFASDTQAAPVRSGKWEVSSDEIHPELRFIGNLIRMIVPYMDETFFAMANFFMDNFGLPDLTHSIKSEEVYISREDGSSLRLRIYSPDEKQENVPGLLWIHGGGYAMGCPEQDFSYIQSFVDASGCVVVAPDYMNSPAAPYPAAFDDCYRSLLWLKENGKDYGMSDDKIFVGGNSAGGGLCAAVTLKARDTGDVNIAFQVPIYPMLDDRMVTQSSQNNDAPVWNSASNEIAWKLYLGNLYGTDCVPAYASPSRATDFSDLPPTLTYIGTVDPFYDETMEYVSNLRQAGIEVMCETYEGCFHGFDLLSFSSPAKEAKEFLIEGFMYAAEHYSAPQK